MSKAPQRVQPGGFGPPDKGPTTANAIVAENAIAAAEYRQDIAVDCLTEGINVLFERLSPVLRPGGSRESVSVDKVEDRQARSPLAERGDRRADLITVATNQIGEILSRLEL